MAAQQSTPKCVMVTGGAGYIGSHTVLSLMNAGYHVVVVDSLCNSHPRTVSWSAMARLDLSFGWTEALQAVRDLAEAGALTFHQVDLRNAPVLQQVFDDYPQLHAVFHLAGLKSVTQSWQMPTQYYANNVGGTLNLLECILKHPTCQHIIFSSSACVYGELDRLPVSEDMWPLHPKSPYGRSKLMIEEMIRDTCFRFRGTDANKTMFAAILRYFNPVGNPSQLSALGDEIANKWIGAHPSGRLGEHPSGIPQNLMPFVTQVAAGRRSCLAIYGNDWHTKDGTGCRDYIHVCDIASGHVKALEKLESMRGERHLPMRSARSNSSVSLREPPSPADTLIGQSDAQAEERPEGTDPWNCVTYNLGSGHGYTVLEIVNAMKSVCGRDIPYVISNRRPGDIGTMYACIKKARQDMDWYPTLVIFLPLDIVDIIAH